MKSFSFSKKSIEEDEEHEGQSHHQIHANPSSNVTKKTFCLFPRMLCQKVNDKYLLSKFNKQHQQPKRNSVELIFEQNNKIRLEKQNCPKQIFHIKASGSLLNLFYVQKNFTQIKFKYCQSLENILIKALSTSVDFKFNLQQALNDMFSQLLRLTNKKIAHLVKQISHNYDHLLNSVNGQQDLVSLESQIQNDQKMRQFPSRIHRAMQLKSQNIVKKFDSKPRQYSQLIEDIMNEFTRILSSMFNQKDNIKLFMRQLLSSNKRLSEAYKCILQREFKPQKLTAINSQKIDNQPIRRPQKENFEDFFPQNYISQNDHKHIQENMKRKQLLKKQEDKPLWQKRHQKASSSLLQNFSDVCLAAYHSKPKMEISLEKRQSCAECKKYIQESNFKGVDNNQCYYTGNFFCNQHMASLRSRIPWKVLEKQDFELYPVSQKSYNYININYERAIIEIKKQQAFNLPKILREFLVVKHQMHLMYDSICDVKLMEPLIKQKLNYCLERNLFSLKNLLDIYSGHEILQLQQKYCIILKHFYRCVACQESKIYFCPKAKIS